MSNHKATQYRLDLGYTTVLRIWREFSNQETCTCRKQDLYSQRLSRRLMCGQTYGKKDEENILHNPLSTRGPNTHCIAPRVPIMALGQLRVPPTAEALVQIESPIPINIATISRLQVSQPVACNVNERCDATTQNTSCNEYNPDLTRVSELLDVAKDTACARVQVAQALSLLCIFEDPVDGREVVVADSSAWPFNVPV